MALQQHELKQQLDALLDSGEKAAAELDSLALEEVTNGLVAWEKELLLYEGADETFLRYVREKVFRYREICGFVADTMYSPLVFAGRSGVGGDSSSVYGKNGIEDGDSVRPVLMKTYG